MAFLAFTFLKLVKLASVSVLEVELQNYKSSFPAVMWEKKLTIFVLALQEYTRKYNEIGQLFDFKIKYWMFY